jgi:hypothetical protein
MQQQVAISRLKLRCNSIIAMIAIQSAYNCNYILLKKVLKYIIHGSHFVRYIFSNNMLQTDLKLHLWFRRYHIFQIQNKERFPSCELLVAGLWDDVASHGWLASL